MEQASTGKLEHSGHADKKKVASVPQSEDLILLSELFLALKKEWTHPSKLQDHEMGRPLAHKRRVTPKAWSRKSEEFHFEGRLVPRRAGSKEGKHKELP